VSQLARTHSNGSIQYPRGLAVFPCPRLLGLASHSQYNKRQSRVPVPAPAPAAARCPADLHARKLTPTTATVHRRRLQPTCSSPRPSPPSRCTEATPHTRTPVGHGRREAGGRPIPSRHVPLAEATPSLAPRACGAGAAAAGPGARASRCHGGPARRARARGAGGRGRGRRRRRRRGRGGRGGARGAEAVGAADVPGGGGHVQPRDHVHGRRRRLLPLRLANGGTSRVAGRAGPCPSRSMRAVAVSKPALMVVVDPLLGQGGGEIPVTEMVGTFALSVGAAVSSRVPRLVLLAATRHAPPWSGALSLLRRETNGYQTTNNRVLVVVCICRWGWSSGRGGRTGRCGTRRCGTCTSPTTGPATGPSSSTTSSPSSTPSRPCPSSPTASSTGASCRASASAR
jgi:hypothetical protein